VGQPAPEARALAVFVVVVDGVGVPGHAREEQEVGVGERARRTAKAIAHREVFEIALVYPALLHHQRLQKISRTVAASVAAKRAGRVRAANGRPSEYQARCFLSCSRASRGGRCSSIRSAWRRMMRARSSRAASAPRKTQGAPSAARPIIT